MPHFGIDAYDAEVVSSGMDLSSWMAEKGLTNAALAERIGVAPNTVNRWRNGWRRPRAAEIALLHKASDGRVTANDFYAPALADAAP